MKQTHIYSRYSTQAFRWAFVKVADEKKGPAWIFDDPADIERMHYYCQLYERAQKPLPGLEPPSVRPTVPAPTPIPVDYQQADSDFFSTLEDVGTLRSLHLVSDGRGGYTATIKITLPDGRQVYRYGRLQSPSGLVQMLEHTIRKDRWTPDKL